MRLVIGLAILAFTQARYTSPKCDNVLVRNIHHEKEILVDDLFFPAELAIHYNTSTLFFSRITDIETVDVYLNLKTNEYDDIPGLHNVMAKTVDNQKNVVYFEGTDTMNNTGLFEFDNHTKTVRHIKTILMLPLISQMFFKNNNIYFTTIPSQHVYVVYKECLYNNGKIDKVPELAGTRARLVALNNDLDFYFTNSSGLFKLSRSSHETIQLGDYNVKSMTADENGNIYFATHHGIYFINENDEINEIALIPNIIGIAIESNGNVIYALENAIVRLKPTNSPCSIDENHLETEDIK